MRKKQEGPPLADGMALISQAKAAEMCGMTREAIHDLVRRRRFRSFEVEGRHLVYLKEVEAFEREDRQRRGR
jgi:protein-tyrosine phosphatase